MTRISLDDVSKYFDAGETVANYRLNLEIEDGEFVVILGPSGCGKTTTLRQIAGLEEPSEGRIYFDDEDVTDWSPSDRNVAMVFQNYALYPHMSVRENIEYPLKVRGVEPAERDRRVEQTTELLHIEDQLEKGVGEISGGQRQRVALARAIVREPSVFLLDEPLSNLDAKLRQEMRVELKRIQSELGVTSVYVTHNQEEAMSMADRVVVMNEGTIRQVAPPEELYARPRTTWVARFIGSPPMNLLRGRRDDGTIDLGDAGVVELDAGEAAPGESGPAAEAAGRAEQAPEPGGGASDGTSGGDAVARASSAAVPDGSSTTVYLGVRPEDLSVRAGQPASDTAIRGTVDTVEPLGEYTIVNVTVPTLSASGPSEGAGASDAMAEPDDADADVGEGGAGPDADKRGTGRNVGERSMVSDVRESGAGSTDGDAAAASTDGDEATDAGGSTVGGLDAARHDRDAGQRVVAKVAGTDVGRDDEVSLTFDPADAYLYDQDGQLLD